MNACMLRRILLLLLVSSLLSLLPPARAHAQLIEALETLFTPSVSSAVDRGLAPGGDLAREIEKLGEVSIATLRDARAVVKAAKALPLSPEASKSEAYSSALSNVLSLFESIDGKPGVINHLKAKGIPELIRIYETLSKNPDEDTAGDLVRLLRVLAMYYTTEGTDCVIDGVQRRLGEDSYWWTTVFFFYDSEHPESLRFYREMREHPPAGPIGLAFLGHANSQAELEDSFKHPFNDDPGITLLKEWLGGEDVDAAIAAVGAIGYIDEAQQPKLYQLAVRHPDKKVRLQATYAQAKLGELAAIEQLAQYCLDVDLSKSAQAYLEELEAPELIPEEASEPAFAAKAELSHWLAHPNELGRAPDEMRIVDQRQLKWFDEEEPRLFTILEFVAKSDDSLTPDLRNVAVVGSMTWSHFSEELRTFSPEDIYAFHYAWEAENRELVEQREGKGTSDEQAAFGSQWVGEPLEDVKFVGRWQFSAELGYPQEAVACASAKIDGKEGFIVFDGPRSHWYPAEQFHPDVSDWHIFRIHIGRVLLGFDLDTDREFTPIPEVTLPPEFIVSEYEKWLLELHDGSEKRRQELLSGGSPLDIHFEKYIDAVITTQGGERNEAVKRTYEQLMTTANALPEPKQADALDIFSALGGSNFEMYAAAIQNDAEKTKALIAKFEPLWDHNWGRSELAKAAFRAGERDTARRLLEKQVELDEPNRHRGESSTILAEIWHSEGKSAEARELLINSIKLCIGDAVEYAYEAEECQIDAERHQAKYRELFADSAESELKEAGLDAPIEQLIDEAQQANESKAPQDD